jgi:signal peptidase I
MRSFRTVLRTTVTLLAGVTVVTVAAYAALLIAGFRPVVVYSGSMVPTLHVGTLALDRPVPASSVRVGDVITFSDPYVSGRLVTHRVIRIFHTTHGLAYRTKGDANVSRDPWTIRLPDRVGRVKIAIPLAGYVLWYAHTREVRTAFIAIAALLLLTALLRRIWREEGPAPAAGDA